MFEIDDDYIKEVNCKLLGRRGRNESWHSPITDYRKSTKCVR